MNKWISRPLSWLFLVLFLTTSWGVFQPSELYAVKPAKTSELEGVPLTNQYGYYYHVWKGRAYYPWNGYYRHQYHHKFYPRLYYRWH